MGALMYKLSNEFFEKVPRIQSTTTYEKRCGYWMGVKYDENDNIVSGKLFEHVGNYGKVSKWAHGGLSTRRNHLWFGDWRLNRESCVISKYNKDSEIRDFITVNPPLFDFLKDDAGAIRVDGEDAIYSYTFHRWEFFLAPLRPGIILSLEVYKDEELVEELSENRLLISNMNGEEFTQYLSTQQGYFIKKILDEFSEGVITDERWALPIM